MTEIQEKSILVPVGARFELARVRVNEGSSYGESTVIWLFIYNVLLWGLLLQASTCLKCNYGTTSKKNIWNSTEH